MCGSPFEARRVETRLCEKGSSCLLLVVVKMRDWNGTDVGIYDEILSARSAMVEVEVREKERVEGRESPGKDVRRMLMFDEAILVTVVSE